MANKLYSKSQLRDMRIKRGERRKTVYEHPWVAAVKKRKVKKQKELNFKNENKKYNLINANKTIKERKYKSEFIVKKEPKYKNSNQLVSKQYREAKYGK